MPPRPRAVLVAIQTPQITNEALDASLIELGRLCHTVGFDVVGQVTQKRAGTGAMHVLGEGKLVELAEWTGGPGVVARGPRKKVQKKDLRQDAASDDDDLDDDVEDDDDVDVAAPPLDEGAAEARREGRRADVVVVDAELSPSQLRNLGSAAGVDTYDRSAVILEIFHRHARSREARLQVEIARLNYVAPRLREGGGGGDRQRGGIGGKGAGESALELDRRRIRDRVAELKRELEAIAHEQDVRRARRQEQLRVALVGYTNAGKSSLMRALTGSEVYVADKLFATLDTTVRTLHPPTAPKVLVSDTVGFIKKLPHDLVASFRSTLDEAREATLLMHVVDGSDPAWPSHYEVTRAVLAEIDAHDVPRILVLNKCDRLGKGGEEALAAEFPDAWRTSAVTPERIEALKQTIGEWFTKDLVVTEVLVPWAKAGVMGIIRSEVEVLAEEYEDEGIRYRIRGTDGGVGKVRAAIG
jgi:GTP-binding protein HflX